MQLIYEGADITDRIDIRKCIHRDVSRRRCDSAEIECEHAAHWQAWQPQGGDRIELIHDGYTTGTLYLNTVLHEGGRYRMIATSLPPNTFKRAWQSFRNTTLGEIMAMCAAECGMEWKLFGLDEGSSYPYIERRNEGAAAFIERLMKMEGASLKCVSGRMAGISIAYAQDIEPMQEIEIAPGQDCAIHTRSTGMRYAGLTIRTPFAAASAFDSEGTQGQHPICTNLPAMNALQAGRWARGMLLMHNRKAESLTLETELNIGMTALARIDIKGGTDADGEWIVDEAEHDFMRLKTRARLVRCIKSIL